jgi:catechol 2,3-dioxygenase-like lactoylglutathione lyase family enzyme
MTASEENRMNELLAIDHIHLISRDAHAAAKWYCDIFDGEITAVQDNLRGAPQIDVKVNGLTLLIRGQRTGEQPAETKAMQHFNAYSSHEEWGIDHFGFTYRGDLLAFCDQLKQKGVRMAVEPWEFKPGLMLCYVAAPDGVSIEIVQINN